MAGRALLFIDGNRAPRTGLTERLVVDGDALSCAIGAASILAKEPITITLRYLQTLAQIGTEKNTTIVFPIPIELLSALLAKGTAHAAPGGETK